MKRQAVDLAGRDARLRSTPWGLADFSTTYAPGIVFFETPSHGGFQISLDRFAAMPEPYRSHPPFCRQAGWYEEDCDWSAVALSFPEYFTPEELDAARRTWSWIVERKAQEAKPTPHLKTAAALRAQDFNEADCGGAFDGHQVTSDADPGL